MVIPVEAEFNFPNIPDKTPKELYDFFIELRNFLQRKFVGSFQVGGTVEVGDPSSIDHGLLGGLVPDDDHTQYLKEKGVGGGTAAETPSHTHANADNCGTVAHGDLGGLGTGDDHPHYLKEEVSGGAASEVPDHTHADAANCGTVDHGVTTGKGDDDHTQYTLANGTRAYTGVGDGFKDEDDMASDSAVAPPSQQSVKAYVNGKFVLGTNILRDSGFDGVLYPEDGYVWITNAAEEVVHITDGVLHTNAGKGSSGESGPPTLVYQDGIKYLSGDSFSCIGMVSFDIISGTSYGQQAHLDFSTNTSHITTIINPTVGHHHIWIITSFYDNSFKLELTEWGVYAVVSESTVYIDNITLKRLSFNLIG